MTVACRALLVVALALASCGGGGDAARVPAPPEVPREQAQDAPPPGSTVAWAEDWSSESWGGWVRHEPIGLNGASLAGDARVGVYVVNVLAEAALIDVGSVHARLGVLQVHALSPGRL